MNKQLSMFVILSFLLCACSMGLNKKARAKVAEIKVQVTELNHNLDGVKTEFEDFNKKLDALNKNLADLKTILSTNLDKLDPAELAATLKRIAEALEALNVKAGKVLGD